LIYRNQALSVLHSLPFEYVFFLFARAASIMFGYFVSCPVFRLSVMHNHWWSTKSTSDWSLSEVTTVWHCRNSIIVINH